MKDVIYFAIAVVVLASLACGESSSQIATPRPTPAVRRSVSSLSFGEIERKFELYTDLQQKEYLGSIEGTRIRWSATVSNVSEAGTVSLNTMGTKWENDVFIEGFSAPVLRSLKKDQAIEFEATIRKASQFLGTLSIWLDDPKFIR